MPTGLDCSRGCPISLVNSTFAFFFLEVAFQTFQGRPTLAAPHLSDRRLKCTKVLVALLMSPAFVANLQTFGEDGEEEKI